MLVQSLSHLLLLGKVYLQLERCKLKPLAGTSLEAFVTFGSLVGVYFYY